MDHSTTTMPVPFAVGWCEWLALPQLGIRCLPAKIDTGARTSALYAKNITPFRYRRRPWVTFSVPLDAAAHRMLACRAPVVNRRTVISSNGQRQRRWTIETDVVLGERHWTIEMTLSDRRGLRYPMLLGRTAMADRLYVCPQQRFLCGQPRLDQLDAPLGTLSEFIL